MGRQPKQTTMGKRRHLAPWGRKAEAARALQPGAPEPEALAALEGKPAIYHCVSRIVWRELVLGTTEKEQFVRLMRRWEGFCRVRVLTYCIMSNHFHILVEVPERPEQDPTDEELLEHLGLIYGRVKVAEVRQELEHYRAQGNHEAAEGLRQRFLARMWDLSWFVRQLKQAYTKWFNKRHGKRGNLWEEKFRSVLVEEGHAARVVAGYIDLNPVRAGMVREAGAYRWSGWGEAVAGKRRACEGIAAVMLERELGRSGPEAAAAAVADRREALAAYGALLAEDARKRGGGAGDRERATGEATSGKRGRGGQRLSEEELLGRRVRYFVDGMVVGSAGFVDGVFALTRGWFGERRRSGARRLAGAETPLRTMRALRVKPLG